MRRLLLLAALVSGELLVAKQFESYPGALKRSLDWRRGYLGSLRPTGSVNVSAASFGIQVVAFAVGGVDRACASSPLTSF